MSEEKTIKSQELGKVRGGGCEDLAPPSAILHCPACNGKVYPEPYKFGEYMCHTCHRRYRRDGSQLIEISD